MISTGSPGCLPNLKENGVSCVVALKLVLRASCTNGKRVAQLLWSTALFIASMLCTVECTRSDTELPCGRYGVVQVFLYPSICCNWYITVFSNLGPCSLCKVSGGPKMLIIISIMALATVPAALSRTGHNTTNLVRWSIIERTYLHSIPAAKVDTDLYSTKSTDISLKWPLDR